MSTPAPSAPPAPAASSAPTRTPVVTLAVPLLVDALLVVVFALLGARTHHDGALTPAAVADVAWPFLVGLAGAYALLTALRRAPAALLSGLVVWLTVLVTGMVLRRLTGDGTALAFVVVATSFTLATFVGWRLLVLLLARLRARS